MAKLNEPTPRKNTFIWKITTFIFLAAVFVNENFAVIEAFGFAESTQNLIKSIGAFIYAVVTFYNFNKSTYDEKIK